VFNEPCLILNKLADAMDLAARTEKARLEKSSRAERSGPAGDPLSDGHEGGLVPSSIV
jgi:hypothetical protein